MKHAILALFLCISLPYIMKAQSGDAVATFDFIYIDNSRPSATDGLSQKQIELIEEKAIEIAETEGHILLYASNEKNPRTNTQASKVSTWLNTLLENDTPFPGNKLLEKRYVREAIYDEVIEVTDAMNFHFFVTDDFVSYIKNEASVLVGMLPNEFAQISNFQNNVNVYLYVNNREGNLDIDAVQQVLEYDGNGQINTNLTFKIIDL